MLCGVRAEGKAGDPAAKQGHELSGSPMKRLTNDIFCSVHSLRIILGRTMSEQQDYPGWQEAVRRIEEAKRSNSTSLDLIDLKLTAIPDSIAQLSNLRKLQLNSNQLTTIPDSIVELPKLKSLHLSGNRLTAIPDSIAELANLENLDIGGNPLIEFPRSLIRLANLRKPPSRQ